jgi:precorrin-6y C5,15-methyltransferase (decarboxylating) CbiE subunit
MGRISVVGIGPGSRDYIIPLAQKAVEEAHVLVGGKRALELFEDMGKETFRIKSIPETLEFIRRNRARKVAVLVSGDPGLFSILPVLKREFGPDALEVIPGIGSIQLAFARMKETFEDAVFLSLHGKEVGDIADRVSVAKKAAILTDNVNTPKKIAHSLLKGGVVNREVWVLENLSYPNERVVKTTLKILAGEKDGEATLSIMIIGDAL